MIFDLEHPDGRAPEPAEVCIIGAGAAGIVLAVELLRRGVRVLLLESGDHLPEPRTQELYSSDLAGMKHEGIHTGRFRIYGGSTTQWGGQILELADHDFTARPWIKGSGWPFAKETLESFYERALVLEGLKDVTRKEEDVWRELGLGQPDLGPDLIPFFSRWCPERNFARLHGSILADDPNAQVYLHANACEMLFAEDGATVRGVRSRTLSGREAVFQARHYVLCLGGIESVRFLLQPHAGGRAPWHENDLLGRHFQDHLDVFCATLVDIHPRLIHSYFENVAIHNFRYEPRFRLQLSEQEKAGALNVGGMVFFQAADGDPRHRIWETLNFLLKGRAGEVSAGDLAVLLSHLPLLARQLYRYKVSHRYYSPQRNTKHRLRVFCEQEPLGQSRITLNEEKDALGQFRTTLDWRISELELKTVRLFVETVRKAFAERGLASVIPDPDLADGLSAKIADSFHHMGGARMAASRADGLVDPNLKLYGASNAYVCSSAVFPCSGFSNPTHTLLALAVRLADHLQTL
jgi:choline dehydrogenase-like flavoprotein